MAAAIDFANEAKRETKLPTFLVNRLARFWSARRFRETYARERASEPAIRPALPLL